MKIAHDAELSGLTTFHISAKASTFIQYGREDLGELVHYLATQGSGRPLLHIGEGSNLLFLSDFDGIILRNTDTDITLLDRQGDSILCRVGAGCCMDEAIRQFISNGWYGMENLSLIPGTAGASAVQNIGAYGVEACDHIVEVETMELATGDIRIWQKDECHYAYRHSIFKTPEVRGRYAVLSVTYSLSTTFSPILSYGGLSRMVTTEGLTAQALRDTIIRIRREKLPDPAVEGNAGSFFMNPVVSRDKFLELQQQYPDMPHYPVDDEHEKIPAGWMIDQCGWKGRSLGPAAVHDRQALVLVNKGGATGSDIVRLSDAVRADVLTTFGIEIHPEVNFI